MPILTSDEITQTRAAVLASGVFSETATIREYTTTTSPSGGQVKTWKDMTGHTSIPCFVSSKASQEQKANLLIQTVMQTRVLLSGYYPNILELMRVVVGGITYEITSVGHDSQTVFTKLIVQKVTP